MHISPACYDPPSPSTLSLTVCDSAGSIPSPEPSLPHPQQTAKTGGDGGGAVTVSSEDEEGALCAVPNMQDWLALRAVGGSKPWKFSTCFSRTSSDD